MDPRITPLYPDQTTAAANVVVDDVTAIKLCAGCKLVPWVDERLHRSCTNVFYVPLEGKQ